jgi:hypothetical protein
MPLWITSPLLHVSSLLRSNRQSPHFHFFLLPLNFISEILAEVIYNLSGECLGNWKKVKNNNDDDNSREIKERDRVFISNGYVLKRYSVSVPSDKSLNTKIFSFHPHLCIKLLYTSCKLYYPECKPI